MRFSKKDSWMYFYQAWYWKLALTNIVQNMSWPMAINLIDNDFSWIDTSTLYIIITYIFITLCWFHSNQVCGQYDAY